MNSISYLLPEITAIFTVILVLITLLEFTGENWKVMFSFYRKRSPIISILRRSLADANEFFKQNKMNWGILLLFAFFSFFVALGVPIYVYIYFQDYKVGFLQFCLISSVTIFILAIFPCIYTKILQRKLYKLYREPYGKNVVKKRRRTYSLSRSFSIYWGFLGFGILYFVIYLYELIPASYSILYGSYVYYTPWGYYVLFLLFLWYASRLRNSIYYKMQNFYFFKFTGIESIHAMVYTSENSLLHNAAKYCRVIELSNMLTVEAIIDNRLLLFEIKWKDVLFIAFDTEYSKREIT